MRGFAQHRTPTQSTTSSLLRTPIAPRAPRLPISPKSPASSPKDKGSGTASLFAFTELDGPPAAPGIWQIVWPGGHDIAYEAVPNADVDGSGTAAAAPTRRFIAKTRTRYRSDDLSTLLPVGQIAAARAARREL